MRNDANPVMLSCILPTADRRALVPQAVSYFLAQDYANKELLIVDDGSDSLADLIADFAAQDERIRYLRPDHKMTLGAKRNFACAEARGDLIAHWDDDDWMASWRLTYQVEALLAAQADLCGVSKLLFYDPAADRAWQYVYPKGSKFWVAGATLCYTKAFWRVHPFPNINIGEDTRFVWSSRSQKMVALDDNRFYVAMVHRGNTSPKRTADHRYQPYSAERIRELLGGDWDFYAGQFPPS